MRVVGETEEGFDATLTVQLKRKKCMQCGLLVFCSNVRTHSKNSDLAREKEKFMKLYSLSTALEASHFSLE